MAPQIGDIGVTAGHGFVAAGIRLITRAPYAHAFLSVDGGPTIIEGDPHGVRYNHLTAYPDVLWLTNLSAGLTDAQRAGIVAWAVAHLGTPYSWIDDAEIGMVDLFHWAPGWMRRRLGSTKTLMCSQLCDAAYLLGAGRDLFPGRLAGAVSPADLWRGNKAKVQA